MKKSLRYCHAYSQPVVGYGAMIQLVDKHPECHTDTVHTSIVVRVEENGNFETLNTEYVYDATQQG